MPCCRDALFLNADPLAALAAMSLHAARAAEAQTGPLGKPIGLQLYTVRDAVAKDLPGTLRAISDIGYREVELAGIPATSATDLRKILNACGLTAPSMHASMADLQAGLQERIDYAKALGTEYLVCCLPVDGRLALPRKPGPGRRFDRLRHHARRLEVERGAAEQDRRGCREGRAALRLPQPQHGVSLVRRRSRVRRAAAPDRSEAGHDGNGPCVGRHGRRGSGEVPEEIRATAFRCCT